MGFYITLATLPKDFYSYKVNIFPITLSLYGLNFSNIIKAL